MKMTFGRLIENNQIVKLLSLLVAIGIWFGVVNGIDSHTTRIVRDVPVQITTLGTAVGRLGLSALLEEELLADVTISGSRNVIGNVTETDISIRPQLSGVVGPGVYELRLDAYDANGLGFEILSIRTPTVQVRFDRMTTKKLALKLDMTGITVPDAYMMGEEYVSPGEVTVTGPETELNLIQSGLVRVAIEEPLEKNTSLNAEVLLLDAENTQVQSPFVTLDSPSATITIPILKKKTLPVAIGFINGPVGWDSETLTYTMTPSEIEIAGPSDSVDNMTELHLGYIDTRTMGAGDIYSIPVSMPTGYQSVENIQNITVALDGANIAGKTVNIQNINLLNAPSDYTITVSSKSISNVELVGPQEALDALTADNLVAEINFLDDQIRVGQVTVPVDIVITNQNSVWVYGEYSAVILVKEKT